MSHGGPFVSQAGEVLYGYGYWKQKLTFTGESAGVPTGGSVIFAWGRHKAMTAVTWSAGLTAATVQTALRTIPEFSDCVVTKVVDNYTFVVDNSPAPHSTPALLYVASNTLSGGTRPYVSIVGYVDGATDNTKTPLTWKAELNIQNALPVADKLNVGTNESTMTKLASQWDVRAPLALGRRELKEREDAQRIWDGNAITFIENQITKPFKQTAPSWDAVSGVTAEGYGSAGYIYHETSNTLLRVSTSGSYERWVTENTWDTNIAAAGATIGNSITTMGTYSWDWIVYNDKVYTSNVSGVDILSVAGGVWSRSNVASDYTVAFCKYDDKLIRLSVPTAFFPTQLSFSTDPATVWESPTTAVLGEQGIALAVGPGPGGVETIYCLSTEGLYTYDFTSATFKRIFTLRETYLYGVTQVTQASARLVSWGGAMYFVSNGSLFQYKDGAVKDVGPWIDQGLPTAGYNFPNRVRVWSVTPTNRWLLVSVATETDYANPAAFGTGTTHLGAVLGYNGSSWHVLVGPYAGQPTRACHYYQSSAAAGASKLFFANGRYVLFNDAIGNPLYWSSQTYEDTGTVITPWFDAAVTHIQHTALMGHLWCRNFTSTSTVESVKVYYQLDDCQDSTLTNIGNDPRKHWVQVLDADGSALNITPTTLGGQAGLVPFFFDRPAAPDPSATKFSQGIQFYKIRFRMDLSGGDAATNTPVVQFLSLQYIAQYPSTDAFSVRFTLENNIAGRTAQMQLNDFRLMHDLAPGQPFAWQDSELHIVKEMNYQSRNLSSGYLLSGTGPKPTITAVMSEQSVTLTEH